VARGYTQIDKKKTIATSDIVAVLSRQSKARVITDNEIYNPKTSAATLIERLSSGKKTRKTHKRA